jgi:Fe2+ or Zn2+ uptake regulation protein
LPAVTDRSTQRPATKTTCRIDNGFRYRCDGEVSDRVAGIRLRYRASDSARSRTPTQDDWSVRLRAAGLTVTAPRKTVLRGLAGRAGSDSAAQVYDLLRDDGSTLGLTSVHRILHAFASVGLVHVFAGREQQFRLCGPDPHAHLVCVACGRVTEVPLELARGWLEPARHTVGFVVDAQRCDLYGWCGGCGPPEPGVRSRLARPSLSSHIDVVSG